jgi:hypothetical protein
MYITYMNIHMSITCMNTYVSDTSEHIRQELEKPQYSFLIVDDSNLNRKMMSKLVMAQG